MSLEIITEREVSWKAKDRYPMVSLIGVTYDLTKMDIFPQRKTHKDLKNKLCISKTKGGGNG